MATGNTREQIAELAFEMKVASLPAVTTYNLRDAQAVTDIAMAVTKLGILLRLATKGDGPTDLFLNCVIIRVLVLCFIAAKDAQAWKWTEDRHILGSPAPVGLLA
jgi:hypothetical protein